VARREAEGGSASAQFALGLWHLQGAEGLQLSAVTAAAWVRKAADLGFAAAEVALAGCYHTGRGVEQNLALAAEWGRKAADQGNSFAQFRVGTWNARGDGVKKDLPLGKRYLELSAAQGFEEAAAVLKELRKCVACGKLDVHHMICSQCRNVRYCDKGCQL
jgi:TPR repeat protein